MRKVLAVQVQDLSSDSKHPNQNLGLVIHICNAIPGEVGIRSTLGFSGCLSSQIDEL